MGILSALFAGVSGLNANGNLLSVIGNNIANTNTIGFKSSRATFADLVSSSLGGGSGSVQTGIGVSLTSLQANFTQGSLITSGNALDMAVDGNGFFMVEDSQGGTFYTRAGQFNLDSENRLVNPSGMFLQGYQADANNVITGTIDNVALPSTTASPKVTSTASLAANLNAQSSIIGVQASLTSAAAAAGGTFPYTSTAGANDKLIVNLNGDGAQTITIPAGTYTAAETATAIQTAVRALTAADPLKQTAYNDFTATQSSSSFTLTSGISGKSNSLPSSTTATVVVTASGNLAGTLNLLATGAGAGPPTTNVSASAASSTSGTNFTISDPTGTSNFSSALTVFDSLGNSHLLTTYFTKIGGNTWNYNIVANSADVVSGNYNSANIDTTLGIVRVASGMLTFDTSGALNRESVMINYDGGTAAGVAGTVTGKAQIDFNGATADQLITFNFGSSITTDGGGATGLDGTTQFGSPNGLVSQSQDGYGAGSLQAFLVDSEGVISGRFSNGQIRSLAQVTLAKFANPLGLVRSGKNLYAESADSGQPLKAAPDSAGLGKVASNSLELSNVDLGEEFINMIAAQRGFQANSKAITTVDEMLQELVNIKR